MKYCLVACFLLGTFFSSSYALSFPRPSGYVTDQAFLLSTSTRNILEQRIASFTASTTHEIAVVTIPKLENETIETAALSLFEEWGIGKKGSDNGVLFLIARDDRVMRIEVGYGLEGVLPDITANAIIATHVTPAFKRGEYDKGVTDGIDAIMDNIKGEKVPTPKRSSFLGSVIPEILHQGYVLFIIVGIFFIFFGMYSMRHGWGYFGKAVVGFIFGFFFGVTFFGGMLDGVLCGMLLALVFSGGGGGVSFPFGGGGYFGSSSGVSFGGFGGGRSGGGGASGRW
ncbi:MAG: hypothetical protein RLZZ308_738 [Candidatus Parcubacteria bacterium]|jgi:uncharacterized protein